MKGQTFDDLDLLAKLLAPRPSKPQGPLIEILDSQEEPPTEDEELANAAERLSLSQEQQEILEGTYCFCLLLNATNLSGFKAAENDWQLKQELPEAGPSFKTSTSQNYGFLNLHTGYFRHVEHTENEANELGTTAETAGTSERRKLRLKHEDEKWDEEYYMYAFSISFIFYYAYF